MANKCVGVAIFGSKGDDSLTAMTWAKKEFVIRNPLPQGYKLCVIVIKDAAVQSDKNLAIDEIEPEFFSKERNFQRADKLQKLATDISKKYFGKMYEGPSMLDNLQRAINAMKPAGIDMLIVATDNLQAAGIDTLIVENAVDASSNPSSEEITLSTKSLKLPAGCSIVLVAKTDGDAESTTVSPNDPAAAPLSTRGGK
ncbi:hypothetical protein U9M48_039075 [Paspalum notatum var. saurae]|uniref:Uncharacterized protein n=1 Tax=Paspalum notatum var. saurae TaxID=547442 RepID=A0AAQ3UN71_PASNO